MRILNKILPRFSAMLTVGVLCCLGLPPAYSQPVIANGLPGCLDANITLVGIGCGGGTTEFGLVGTDMIVQNVDGAACCATGGDFNSYFEFEVLDISSFQDVSILMNYTADPGTYEDEGGGPYFGCTNTPLDNAHDQMVFTYALDGGPFVQDLYVTGTNQADFTGVWNVMNLNGNTLTIRVYAANKATAERFIFSNLTVRGTPLPIDAGGNQTVCGAQPVSLNGSGAGTWSGGSGTFDDPGQANTTYTPSPAEVGSVVTLTFTGNPATPACGGTFPPPSDQMQVTVQAPLSPSPVPFGPLCQSVDPVLLPADVSGIPGDWSGPGVAANEFDPDAPDTGPGTYTLTFTPDPGTCANPATIDVTINPAVDITLASPTGPFCSTDGPITLATDPDVSGFWSGPGVVGSEFDPSTANIGLNTITFDPSFGSGCFTAESFDFNLEVQSGAAVNLDPLGPFCELETVVSLDPAPDGVTGTWSGDGVSGTQFSPAAAGDGTTTLTFTPAAGGTCTAPSTIDVVVSPQQTYNLLPPPGAPFCADDASDIPLGATFDGITGSWSGPGVTGNNFIPQQAGAGNPALTFTPDPGQCATDEMITVVVEPAITPVLDDLGGPYCSSGPAFPLPNPQDGVTGTWSGTGVSAGNFDPALAADGPNTLTFTPVAGCAQAATATVTVIGGPTANPPTDNLLVCVETIFPPAWTDNLADIISQINGGTGQTVTWYLDAAGTNEIDPLTYIPTVIGSGTTQTIYATVTDGSGCESATVPVTLTFEFTPDANPIPPISECEVPGGTIDLTAYDNQISPGNTVNWYEDAGTNIPVPNPSAYPAVNGGSVWAAASGGLCESDPVQVTFDLTPQPAINPVAPVTACGSYTLPPITGSNLSGSAAYFSGPNGTGQQFNPGQALTASGTYYAFDSSAPGCSDEASFLVTINTPPDIFPPAPVVNCGPYTLPPIDGTGLSPGAAYYTGPNGTGQQLFPGSVYDVSGTLFLYDGTPGCDDQETLSITIQDAPVVFPVNDVLACDGYTLPPIQGTGLGSNAFYYTGPNATGNILTPGETVTGSQLLYAYAGQPGCFDEQSFLITIVDGISITPLPDQAACNSFTFPPIEGENLTATAAYYTGPNGSGVSYAPGETVTASGIYYLFDDNTVCADEAAFTLAINTPPTLICSELTPASGLGSADGEGLVNITGSAPPYLVEWSGPVSGNQSTSDIAVTIGSLLQGAYTVTVTDDNGCAATCSFTITAPDCALNFDFDIQGASCPNTPDGAALLTVTGGDGNYSYNWSNGVTANSIVGVLPGAYSVTVTDGTDCQAEDTLVIDTLHPAPALVATATPDTLCETGCVQYALSFSGTPPFSLSYQVRSGADTLQFGMTSTVADTAIAFCPADSLPALSSSLVFDFGQITDANCADTLGLLDTLVVLPTRRDTLFDTLCLGESLTVNGTLYDETNLSGSDTLLNGSANGCDSIITVQLSFFEPDTNFLSQTLCTGSSLTVNGTVYDAANPTGFETLPGAGANGCDSLVSISLSFEDAVVNAVSDTLCPGGTLTVNGTLYDETNLSGSDTLLNGSANGCDSIITVQLSFFEPDTNFLSQTLCTGSSLTVNGTVYDAANPTGFETLPGAGANGCDSLVSISLSFEDAVVNAVSDTLCPGGTLTVNGTLYDETNLSGSDTLLNGSANGCDSIITVQLSFFEPDTNFLSQTLCTGSSLTVNGTVYDAANPTGFETLPGAGANGCDSLVSISLSFEDAVVNAVSDTLCPGGTLTVNGTLYDETNLSGSDTLLNGSANGCDSIITVQLSFFEADTNFLSQTLCTGSSLTVNGTVYDAANPTGFETLPGAGANGCDSLVSISLSFEDAVVNAVSDTLCPGGTLTVNGTLYDETNLSGSDTLLNGSANGCDSIITVQLSFFEPDTNFLSQTLCTGSSLTVNGTVYDAANPTGFETLPGAGSNGCDSLVSISLSFEDAVVNAVSDTLCPGGTLTVNGTLYDETNLSGSDTLLNGSANGCDSIITVQLSFFEPDTNFLSQTLCTGSSLTVNGTVYDAANPTGFETLPGAGSNGCDSLVSISLSFEEAVVNAVSDTLCPGGTLTVNGTLYDETNLSGSDTLLNGSANGCDSIITVQLSFFEADTNFLSQTLCTGSSLTVNGTVYDATNPSGFETLPGAGANGCDSIISVTLDFLEPGLAVLETTLCPGESLEVNGVTYDALNPTGQDTLSGAAANGCDSIIQVSLSFDTLGTRTLMQTLCPGESLTVNGVVYDQSNPAGSELIAGGASNGCDSLVVVSLDFLEADTNRLETTLCAGESLTVNGTLYDEGNPSGFEVLSGLAANGCDSFIVVDLAFEEAVTGELALNLCSGASITVNGNVYDETNPSGTELLEGAAINGCDSLVSIDLAFQPVVSAFISGESSLCPGDSATLTFELFGADTFDFNLNSESGLVEAFTGVTDGFTYTVSPASTTTYTLTNLSGAGNFCEAEVAEPFIITVAEVEAFLDPTVTYGDFEISCAGSADGAVEATATGGTPPYTYQWSDGGSSSPERSGLGEGTYSVTVSDAGACSGTASITLTAPASLLAQTTAIDANCLRENSGQILIDTILGGSPPYQSTLDGGAPITIGALPFRLDNLSAGNYTLDITDANGCRSEQLISINAADSLSLGLGGNRSIQLGESIRLVPMPTFDVAAFSWSPDSLAEFSPLVSPTETTAYRLVAQDSLGCSASDQVTIIVERHREVYAPNVFSPNGDGNNDRFTLFAGSDVLALTNFRIFDRWGEMVYEGPQGALNNEALGWDGNHQGEPMDPGVFVFYAEVEFIDGHVELIKGDFVLMR